MSALLSSILHYLLFIIYYPLFITYYLLYVQDAEGSVIDSRWAVAGLDAIPIDVVLPEGVQMVAHSSTEWQVSIGLGPLHL